MKYAKWILILTLALAACSERSASPPTAAKQAGAPETNAPAGQASNLQQPNPVIATPRSPSAPSQAPAPSLKPKYPDKTAFLADVKAVKPVMAVDLDGQTVVDGFGPAMHYRTGKDGSVAVN